jgi:hypothetical protein
LVKGGVSRSDEMARHLIQGQRTTGRLAQGFERQVIVGGPQAAGGDDQSCPVLVRAPDLADDGLEVVVADGDSQDLVAEAGEPPGQRARVGVLYAPAQDLPPHGDDDSPIHRRPCLSRQALFRIPRPAGAGDFFHSRAPRV